MNHYYSRDEKGYEANHEKNSPKISHDEKEQHWLGKTKLSGRLEMLLKRFGIFCNGVFYWLTNCLPACLSTWYFQICVTQQWLRLRAWFFHCSTSPQPERCLLPYCCTCNPFFMVPSFVSHSSFFTAKCWFFGRHVMASIHNRNHQKLP